MGAVGQVTPVRADVTNYGQISRAVRDADMVISMVGILHQSGRNTFEAVQARGPELIARAAREAGVARLIHISAIGADPDARALYARSKGLGEVALQEAFPEATILRPSIVFGPDDTFFNRFAAMAMVTPALPLIGGGHTRFQPVFVQDVASAVIKTLEERSTAGRIYELGGPRVYSFRELLELMMAHTMRRRRLVHLPFALAAFKARFLELLPNPPLTRDQVELLKTDNVADPDRPGLAELEIGPIACEVVLPTYLDRFRPGGRYTEPDLDPAQE